MVEKRKIDKFVTSCSIVFKSYDYDVVVSKNKSNLWHFTAAKDDGKFVIYCAPQVSKVKGIIKVALKKVPKGSKLVIICNEFTEEEAKLATEGSYSIITLKEIKTYGTQMIEAKMKERRSAA